MRLPLPPNDNTLKAPEAYSFALVPELAKTIEPVGKFYALLQGKVMRDAQREQIRQGNEIKDADGNAINVEDSAGESSSNEEEKGDEGGHNEDYEKKRKKKTKAEIEKEALASDHYKILNLEDCHEATEAQITKAFRKMALTYHPDKLGDKANANTKKIWLQIQKAYDTLTDDQKRKKYDSSLPFDDKIPKESELDSDEAFFELFKKCFATNAKFAVIRPVPDLGDLNTPIEEVWKFYRYWDSFKTWREFSQYDEYDTEEAQDRYEKRWMEQQNRRGRKGYEKDERKRLIKMSTRCYDHDPRIQAQIKKEAEEKMAVKQAKKDAKAAVWAEKNAKLQAKEDDKQAVLDNAKALALAEKEEKKKKNQKYRATVKELAAFCTEKMPGTNYDRFYVDELVKKYKEQEALEALIEKIKSIEAKTCEDFVKDFLMLVDTKAQLLKIEKAKELAEKLEEKKKAQENIKGDWTQEELENFQKAVVRFPTGTGNRWQVIADYIGSRTQKQTIAKAKEIQAKKQKDVDDKRQAEVELEERKAGYKKEAEAKAKKEAAQLILDNKEKAKKKMQAEAAKAEKAANATVAAPADPNAWTREQQGQMEKGMKQVPSTVATKERWVQISALVEGKTPKECFTRFKELCAAAKAAK